MVGTWGLPVDEHGLVHRAQVKAAGWSDTALAEAVARRELQPICSGTMFAVVLASRPTPVTNVRFGSAAAALGLPSGVRACG